MIAAGNLLVWPPNQKDSKIEFVEASVHHRIIVNRMENTLSRKVLGELRTWQSTQQQFVPPPNLRYEDVQATSQIQASKIWDGYTFKSFGDAKNTEPTISSNSPSADSSDPATAPPDPKIASIAGWANKIEGSAPPDTVPEAPVDPITRPTRLVAVDSDSDDDEPHVSVSKISSTSVQEENRHFVDMDSWEKDLVGVDEASDLLLNSALSDIQEDRDDAVTAADGNAVEDDAKSDETTTPNQFTEEHPSLTRISPTPESLLASPSSSNEWLDAPEKSSSCQPNTSVSNQASFAEPFIRPAFDPNAYTSAPNVARGQRGQNGQRGGQNSRNRTRNRGSRSQWNNHPANQAHDRPGQDNTRGSQTRRGANFRTSIVTERQSRGGGSRGDSEQAQHNDLVDVRAPITSHAPRVPPGFEAQIPLCRAEGVQENQVESPNIRGESLPNSTMPQISHRPRGSQSTVSTESRIRFSDEGADYITTHVPQRSQAILREQAMQQAMEAMAASRKASQALRNKKAEDGDPPKLNSTMRQQGRNPGKKSVQQETAAQRKARIEEAKRNAYGFPQPHPRRSTSTTCEAKPEGMSLWKKQQLARQTTPMAEAHPEIVGHHLRDQQCNKLISLLTPVFETGRAFAGDLTFEIQFGQVLISPGPDISDRQFYDQARWSEHFDSTRGRLQTFTTFTKILTTNGADIDRVLEMKAPAKSGYNKFWNPLPECQSVSYEFSCLSKSNEVFHIAIDETGNHELLKGLVTVGTINIHVPAQIWDASASLSGPLKWSHPPEALAKSAANFVKSVYVVPNQEKLSMVFRQPADHEIKIRNLIVKRVSHHVCNLPGHEDLMLKTTEAKSLLFKVHPQDKRLWYGHEGSKEDYGQLAHDGRIHYEMSLVHTGINQVLAKNECLEIGELTDAATTGKSLLDRDVIRSMLDTTVQMVSRIDFVGLHNFGTQERLDVEEHEHQRKLQDSLGPAARSALLIPTGVPGSSVSGFPTGSRVHTGTVMVMPLVPGVRMNTHADRMLGPDGKEFLRGMGGAMVPIAELEEGASSSQTIGPDDSASQVGGPSHPRFQVTGMRGVQREPGFW